MRCVFADTSFYAAVIGNRDKHHEQAMDFIRGYRGMILTTDFIVVELGNFLFRTPDRSFFASVARELEADNNTTVLEAKHEHVADSIRLYGQREDKSWSLTDCISFVVMQEHGLTEALTADRHFEQAGFVPLLA